MRVLLSWNSLCCLRFRNVPAVSGRQSSIIVLMRIPARWWWVPLAVTVAGVVYLSMVNLSQYQAAQREPAATTDTPKAFVAPPAPKKQEPILLPEVPGAEVAPLHPAPPSLPSVELPPFQPAKTK